MNMQHLCSFCLQLFIVPIECTRKHHIAWNNLVNRGQSNATNKQAKPQTRNIFTFVRDRRETSTHVGSDRHRVDDGKVLQYIAFLLPGLYVPALARERRETSIMVGSDWHLVDDGKVLQSVLFPLLVSSKRLLESLALFRFLVNLANSVAKNISARSPIDHVNRVQSNVANSQHKQQIKNLPALAQKRRESSIRLDRTGQHLACDGKLPQTATFLVLVTRKRLLGSIVLFMLYVNPAKSVKDIPNQVESDRLSIASSTSCTVLLPTTCKKNRKTRSNLNVITNAPTGISKSKLLTKHILTCVMTSIKSDTLTCESLKACAKHDDRGQNFVGNSQSKSQTQNLPAPSQPNGKICKQHNVDICDNLCFETQIAPTTKHHSSSHNLVLHSKGRSQHVYESIVHPVSYYHKEILSSIARLQCFTNSHNKTPPKLSKSTTTKLHQLLRIEKLQKANACMHLSQNTTLAEHIECGLSCSTQLTFACYRLIWMILSKSLRSNSTLKQAPNAFENSNKKTNNNE